MLQRLTVHRNIVIAFITVTDLPSTNIVRGSRASVNIDSVK